MNLSEINTVIKDLPQSALALCPDDAALIFLTQSLPSPVTEGNAKTTMTILSLICRRLAINFNDIGAEFEAAIREHDSESATNGKQSR